MRGLRRIAVVVALVSSSIACGGFLGFGDDEDDLPPAPQGDGGPDGSATDASGGTTVDRPLVCETLVEDFSSFGDNTQLPEAGWRRFFGSPSCGLLGFDGGALVAELPATDADGGPCTATNAGLFRRFDRGVRSIECEVDVTVNSFDGRGAFLEYRVEQGTSFSTYRANAGWNANGMTGRATDQVPGGPLHDDLKSAPGLPNAGTTFRVRARLESNGTFTFRHQPDPVAPLVSTMPEAGAADFWELYVGVTESDRPRAITIDNVTCEACR